MSSAFSPAFLDGESRAQAFLSDDFRRAEARTTHARRAGLRQVSAQTLAALRTQNAGWTPSGARERHLDRLAKGGTPVVVTGQQVGLFLGPLYAFYKAATAIAVARELDAVPVFWLQSEDHDFAELDHCTVLTAEGCTQRLTVDDVEPGHPRRSVSARTLGPGVTNALEALSDSLEGLPHTSEVLALLRRHYQPQHGWVAAFAGMLAEVFADDGLVLLDPRDAALAEQVVPLHRRAIAEHEAIARVLTARADALEAAGFDVQVPVRDDVPLTFVHPEGRDGPRLRGAIATSDDPLCFSSSALLRPLVQDTLLPTAAMVGGPGELNYFAQLPPLYAYFGLQMPMAVPRARFRVVSARERALLSELGLTASALERPLAQVLASLRPASDSLALEQRLMAAVTPILDSVPRGIDDDAVARTRGTMARAASRLSGRYERAVARRDETMVKRVERLQASLFPGGAPQERTLCLPSLAARVGVAAFKALVMESLVPFEPGVKEVSL